MKLTLDLSAAELEQLRRIANVTRPLPDETRVWPELGYDAPATRSMCNKVMDAVDALAEKKAA